MLHICTIHQTILPVNPEDYSVVLRARKKIQEGEEITRSYVPAVYGEPKRKQDLWKDWGISCCCKRCEDVTEGGTFVSAIKCRGCGEGLITPENSSEGNINYCGDKYQDDHIQDPSGDAGPVPILMKMR